MPLKLTKVNSSQSEFLTNAPLNHLTSVTQALQLNNQKDAQELTCSRAITINASKFL